MNFSGAGLIAVVLAIQEKPIITGDCSDENFNRLAITHGRYLKSLWASAEIKTGQDLAVLIQEEDKTLRQLYGYIRRSNGKNQKRSPLNTEEKVSLTELMIMEQYRRLRGVRILNSSIFGSGSLCPPLPVAATY